MDPKHQFAAQYVLSRAAAEKRERDTLLAAVSASASSSGLLGLTGMGGGGMYRVALRAESTTKALKLHKIKSKPAD